MQDRFIVLYLPKWFPCKNRPLNGSFIKRHGESVSKFCQINVVYAVADPTLKKGWFNYDIHSESGLQIVKVYYRKNITGIGKIDKLIKSLLYLISLFKGYNISKKKFGKPSLVHVHVLLRPAILALYLKTFKKIKYVISEHWTGYLPIQGQYRKVSFLKKELWKIAVKRAHVILPDSKDLGFWMQRHGLMNKYITIHNAVDVNIFKMYSSEKPKKRIIHVSSLKDIHKNVSGIIRVIKKLYQIRQDFELFIVGNAHDYEKLKKMAIEEHLLDKVIFFLGKKTGEELAKIISSGDFFILFSNYENQPCVIGEAFACGLPVLATSVGDIPSIVSDDFGKIIMPRDEEALLEGVNFMLDNTHIYNKEKLISYARNHFSNEVIGRKLFDIYTDVHKN